MKERFLAFAAGLLLLSCNQTKDASVAGDSDHMATASRNTEHTKEIYRAIETGDMSKMDSLVAKDVVDHEGNMGKDIVGLDSLKAFLGKMHTYFDGLKFDVLSDATSHEGDYHFSLVRMTGKAKANPWGMPVGRDIDDTSVDVTKIKDGKATDHWGFTSMKDMMEMMPADGKMPPPPPVMDSTHKKM